MKNYLLFPGKVFVIITILFAFAACGGGDDDGPITPPKQPETPSTPSNGGTDTPPSTPQGTMQLTRTCTTCFGSKNCQTCKGTGKGCKTCGGTGRYCKDCNTTGDCQKCNGTGDCKFCGATGELDCNYCDGRGRCPICDGKGWTWHYENKCSTCKGTGDCKDCGRSGKRTCIYCDGDKRCNDCRENRGKCKKCKGNPQCKTCGGDGHCADCTNHDGKCKTCKGEGQVGATSIRFSNSGGSEKIFITSNTDWKVTSNEDWLSFSSSSGNGNNTLTINASVNSKTTARNGIVTFTYGSNTTTISIYQEPEPEYLTLSSYDPIKFGLYGGSETLTITSNVDWKISCNESWLNLSTTSGSGSGILKLSVDENKTVGTRDASVIIYYSNTSATIKVSQEGLNFSYTPSSLSTFASLGDTQYVSITSNVDWKVSSSETWLSVTPTSGHGDRVLTITAKVNNTSYSRNATVTFTSDAGNSSLSIRQEAGPTTPFVINKVEFANVQANGTVINDYGVKSTFERYEPKYIKARILCADYVSGSYDIYYNIVTPDGYIPKNAGSYTGKLNGHMTAGETYYFETAGFQFVSNGYYGSYWDPGKYRFDFYYNGKLMASNTFQVYY